MGLDMFVFAMKKMTKEEKEKLETEPNEKNTDAMKLTHYTINKETKDRLSELLQVFPDSVFDLMLPYYDMEKIWKEHDGRGKYPGGYVCLYGDKSTGFHIGEKYIELSNEEIDQKYIFEKSTPCLVVHTREAAYWRKNDDLQEKIYEQLNRQIENQGYYGLSEDDIEALAHEDRQFAKLLENRKDDETYFYHEWY